VNTGWASAGDVIVVVHVVESYLCHHIPAVQRALVGKSQLGPAAVMANRVPVLVSLYPRTGAIATQHWWEWV
jgi:hypothetical protein